MSNFASAKIKHYAEGGAVDESNVSETDDDAQDSSSEGAGQLSTMLGGSNNINLLASKGARPLSIDDKGIVTFSNGVRHFPDGHIEQQTSDGSRWFKANPYSKMMRLPSKDPDQILSEKAAAKGLRRVDFGSDDEFKQAARTALGGTSEQDAQSIADGVQQGNIPPTLQGLYRMRGRVGSILQQRGYDLKNASLDYYATQRSVASQNSPAFQKQRAALDFTETALNKVDDLANQWKAGGFKLLNHARLVAAVNGALGPEAAKIATQLNGQINDMIASTSQVYMGGNSPTDQAMKIAGGNLSADWSEDVLHSMTKLLRDNIQIRRNSINHLPAIGTQGPMPQAGQAATSTTAPQAQAASQPQNDQGALKFVADHSKPGDPQFNTAQQIGQILKSKGVQIPDPNAGSSTAAAAGQ